jgi:hypothetical protein
MHNPSHGRYALIGSIVIFMILLLLRTDPSGGQPAPLRDGATIRVPQDHSTIQAAIDAAADGDTVLVAPGVYREELRIEGKQLTLASRFLNSREPRDIEATVLDGSIPRAILGSRRADAVIDVRPDVGPQTRIIGFTIRGGDDGIRCAAEIEILHNRIVANRDGIDYESGGGTCRYNVFEENEDDAVDLDDACEATIEDNLIRNNDDDGIEIRLQNFRGPGLTIVIRGNRILGNREDGIQIIDYPGKSDRLIRIERNLIADTAMAAIGFMADANTKEDYQAADVPERVEIVGNTLANNHYGITGGDSVVAINNVIVGTKMTAVKKVDGGSILAFNLLWNNGDDNDGSNLDAATTLRLDPRLGDDYRPVPGSPCIDAGAARFERDGQLLMAIPNDSYVGRAPDLGAFEAAE